MQRSASLSSVASRLNNLEQIVDKLEPSDGSGGDTQQSYDFTIRGSASSISDETWAGNHFFRTYDTSLALITFGSADFTDAVYARCHQRPFYHRVFDRFDARFDDEIIPPLASLALGFQYSEPDYFTALSEKSVGNGQSFIHTVLSATDYIEKLNSGMCNHIFGAADNIEDLRGNSIYEHFTRELEDLNNSLFREPLGAIPSILQRLDNIENRLSYLESKI